MYAKGKLPGPWFTTPSRHQSHWVTSVNLVKRHRQSGKQNVMGNFCDKDQNNNSSMVTIRHDVTSVHTSLKVELKYNVCEGGNYLVHGLQHPVDTNLTGLLQLI